MKLSSMKKLLAVAATVAALLLSVPVFAQMLPVSALKGKKVLFVTGEPEADHPTDDGLVKKHLESLGFVVTMAKETDPATKANGMDLVVISSTANAHVLQATYRDVSIPVFTWNTYEYPEMRMTGPHLHTDFEVVDPVQHYAQSFSELYGYIASATSPITESLGLKSELFGTLYLRPATVGWGKPAASARVVTNFEGFPRRAGIFTYEKDSSMYDDFVAPARRVGFYLSDDNFHLLTAVYGPGAKDPELRAWYSGLKLFDASVRWAVSPPVTPQAYDPSRLHEELAQAAKGKKLLFVERINAGEGKEADEHMVAHLKALGFDVTIADQMDPQAKADGMDMVVLSATCSKYKLANKYRDTTVPVLVLEGLFADTMRMAGRGRYVDYGEHGEEKESDDPPENYLNIVGAWSPMAAGLKPGLVKFTNETGTIKWARPTPDATVIATLPNEDEERAIFGYAKGATMDGGFLAPARRTLFPLDNPAFDDLTPQGVALFDATVMWTLTGK